MTIRRAMMMLLALAALLCAPPARAAAAPIRTLLLSGDNNHDWKTTTPYLKQILEQSGRFTVDVTEHPETMTPQMLAPYDLVLSNWTNYPDRTRVWGPVAEQALFSFVRDGKGFALFHAAAATFPDWPEFAKLAGAGWVPRIAGRPNYGSGHGARHTFKIEVINKQHPITQGLQDFYANDELWHRLAAVPGVTTLTQAFSALDKGGTGHNEPMSIVHDYGKGRVFFLVPGHDVTAMSSPAWRTLMLRGAEWAATGKVTIAPLGPWPSTPESVPAPAPKPAKAKKAKAPKAKQGARKAAPAPVAPAASAAPELDLSKLKANLPQDPDALITALASLKESQSPVSFDQYELALQSAVGADAAKQAALAAKLASALAGQSTEDARRFFIRQLGVFGSAREVPPLAALLKVPNLAEAALAALERIPAPESVAALRKALPQARGQIQLGLINALGNRGDAASVDAIAARLGDANQTVAAAAADALGKIDDPAALDALSQFADSAPSISPALIPGMGAAALRHGERALAQNDSGRAAQVFQGILARSDALASSSVVAPLRRAALLGLFKAEPEQAGARALEALRGQEPALQLAALQCVKENKAEPPTAQILELLPNFTPKTQAAALAALAGRGDKAALPAALKSAAESPSESVRLAALDAVARMGGASAVAPLAKMAQGKSREALAPIHAALVALRGPDVNQAILAELRSAPTAARPELFQALIDRDARDAAPELLKLASSTDSALRPGAIRALGALAAPDAAPALLTLIQASKTDNERQSLASALAEISRRSDDPSAIVKLVSAPMNSASGPARAALLGVLGAIGGAEALPLVLGEARGADPELRAAAIRALAAWPDGAPARDLLDLASSERDPRLRALALRGFASLLAKADAVVSPLSPSQKVDLVKRALNVGAPAEEKKALLAQLGQLPTAGSLQLTLAYLRDPALADEAAQAATQIAEGVLESNAQAALDALKQVAETAPNPAVKRRARALIAAGAPLPPKTTPNLALGAAAEGTKGLNKDGQASGPLAAIDGKASTYWDEEDGQKLYNLKVTLPAPAKVASLRIMGYQHQNYAPKDFEVLCDGKPAARVESAVYHRNLLEVAFPSAVSCKTVELRITGYYGQSPAIRELMLYGPER